MLDYDNGWNKEHNGYRLHCAMIEIISLSLSAVALVASLGAWVHLRERRFRRLLVAALKEQDRREGISEVDYRPDQRLRAIQQRLSRKIGKRAFADKSKKRIQERIDG